MAVTFYESNPEVRPTGAEIAEFVDVPTGSESAPAESSGPADRVSPTDEKRPAAGGTHLRIYLNDHRAGAAGGIALAQRSRDNNGESELGTTMQAIVDEFTSDATTLARIADHLGCPPNPVKTVAARVGEFVGRAKTNGHLREYSPLSRLLELEALLAAIDAKRSLWRSLQTASVPVPDGVDLQELEQRATRQRETLRPFHADAARDALVD